MTAVDHTVHEEKPVSPLKHYTDILKERQQLREPFMPSAKLDGWGEPLAKPTGAGKILREAADLVDGPREVDHGDKEASFEGIARVWAAYLTNKFKRPVPLDGLDVAQMMVLLKMTRPQFGVYKADHYLDQCGYSGISGQLAEALDKAAGKK